ncbi:MAG: tRNA (adenosine(37)-N6)-dimethylallyltransferase MiaA [Candidatus Kerfeldbacteria bacterium]|nr:tRNA (adenosine(37)-N6)-dimethylallyltransferase MiaA [Candidatus Kerfeldbacteria bacterium]
MKPMITIIGPTASGKSKLALKLAKKFGGYVISADSRQVYKGMDIGTAKPSKKDQRAVRHFMVDVVQPNQPFTVADHQRRVFRILKKEKGIPFLVGGTGLYVDAILQNWEIPKGKRDLKLRQKLERQSLHLLAKRLTRLDPKTAATIDLHNKRRVIRALEVALAGGSITERKRRPFPYRVLMLGIDVPRATLVQRINARVDQMIRAGLVDEVQQLGKQYGWDSPAMSGIGYKEIGRYLRGQVSLDEAVERIKISTRQYAKRQMTWWKRTRGIQWIRSLHGAGRLVRNFLVEKPSPSGRVAHSVHSKVT